jgi:hypothetical protein
MLRKTILALGTAAVLSAAALAPTAASAHPGGGWGWHGGWGFHPFVNVYAGPVYDGCEVQRWVRTSHGTVLRWVNRCY